MKLPQVSLSHCCTAGSVPKETTKTRVFNLANSVCWSHNCATCSRQGIQPKCRRKTSKAFPLLRTSPRETCSPSAEVRVKVGAGELSFIVVNSNW